MNRSIEFVIIFQFVIKRTIFVYSIEYCLIQCTIVSKYEQQFFCALQARVAKNGFILLYGRFDSIENYLRIYSHLKVVALFNRTNGL